jgi:enoyl-CoA hydratase
MKTLKLQVENGVAAIVLDRPEARNALNLQMCEELCEAALAAAADPQVRVVFVRGSGPVFCAGADVKERSGMSEEQVRQRRMKGFAAYEATPDAVFGTPEAQRGTVGATQRLPRVLGKRLAKDLMFTGRRLSAEEARIAGLVSRISEDLEGELQEITKAILQAPAEALRLAKQCIDRGVELDPRGALEVEIAAIEEQLSSGKWMGKS